MKFIKLKYFEIAETPVTQAQWEKVMGSNPSRFKGKNNPVEMVSFHDAHSFIEKLNQSQKKYLHRLPTEEEWELACGPDLENVMDYSWCYENSNEKSHPVKQKKPNSIGLYDMLGNVWEWTSSFYFKDQTETNSDRVFRGGSWNDDAQALRSADRAGDPPGDRSGAVGFRLVRTLVSLSPLTLDPSDTSESAKRDEAISLLKQALKLLEDK